MTQQRFLGIELTAGVTGKHMLAYLFVALVSSGFAGLLALLEPGLWQLLEIPVAEQALYTSRLRGLQEIYYIGLMGVFGALSDRLGRRRIYALGMGLIALGIGLYPWATGLAELMLFRSLIAIGGAAMMAMLVAVVADYSVDATRGRANGVQAFAVTLGAFVPMAMGILPKVFVSQGLDELTALRATFAVSAGLGFSAALVAWFGLSPAIVTRTEQVRRSLWLQLQLGLQAARGDERIALSYGAAFISRGDLAVAGTFMGLWIGQVARYEMELQTSDAMLMITSRVFTTVLGALVGALLLGRLFDKMSRVQAVSLSAGMAAAVYLAMGLVDDPTSSWVWVLMFFIGIAEISAFISSQALVGQYAPAEVRGAVIGFFGTAGAVGILVGAIGGGELYRRVGPGSPFVLFGLFNFMVFAWSLWVRRRHPQS